MPSYPHHLRRYSSQGYALLEGLRTVQGVVGRRHIIEAATTPLVRAVAALHPGGASAADVSSSRSEEELHSARLLCLMLQHLMTELNGSYTDEGPRVWV